MCGNWGLLCLAELAAKSRRRGEALPEGLEKVLREMLAVVEMRGAQAGGLTLTLCGENDVKASRVRVLKPKRGNLAETLFSALHRKTGRFGCLWGTPNMGTVLVQGHSRFGTSSAPAVIETHPHQWSSKTTCSFWRRSPRKGWVRKMVQPFVTITHNGDFDAWKPYRDTLVGVGTLGMWLDRVLSTPNHAAGDSPKIAGVLELLVCQGLWLHAVRLAYHLHVACHVNQAGGWEPLSPTSAWTVPDASAFRVWADVLDDEFARLLEMVSGDCTQHPLSENTSLDLFVEEASSSLSCEHGGASKLLKRWVPEGKVRNFVRAAAEAFRDNDMLGSTIAFLRRAEGTFGLTVGHSVWPEQVVLAARGQPMSVGFGEDKQGGGPAIAVWSSEPAAIRQVASSGAHAKAAITARFDLNDQQGEVLQLTVGGGAADSDNAVVEAAKAKGIFPVQLTNGHQVQGTRLEACGFRFRANHLSEEFWSPEQMTADSFRRRLTWLVTTPREDSNTVSSVAPDAKKSKRKDKDIVASEIDEIPSLLEEIDMCWSDTGSMNSSTADHFARLLLARASCAEHGLGIDLLVFGVESSLWLAQQFCADLTQLFPNVRAVAMSSNVLLGLLQDGPGAMHPYNWASGRRSLQTGPHTLCLAVSHSGTTYPTVWAARLLRQRTDNVFGLAGSFDCLLAGSIQPSSNQLVLPRFFSSLAGIRSAEAATVSTVALHHTLSHLLLCCAAMATATSLPSLLNHTRELIVNGSLRCRSNSSLQSSGMSFCTASSEAVMDMQRLLLTLYWGACASCGVDASGRALAPEHLGTHRELRQAGHRWSHHITEGYWATFVPAAYVMITVTTGKVPFVTLGGLFLETEASSGDDFWWLPWLLRFLDALVYVFLPIITAMVHRLCTGRRVYARFTTRTLLVTECTVNYKLLRAYVSKLMALSWRFATLTVVGQNGTDHLVHEFTHKAQSDVLMAVGLPDGRLHTSASAEACTLMSVQQAKFIKRAGKGVEVCSLGHNRWARHGLCSRVLALPTRRPIFVGEQLLLWDQIGSKTFGDYGLTPGTMLQRWSDLLTRQMDPLGAPGMYVGAAKELRERFGSKESIDFDTALKLLDMFLDRERQKAHGEMVFLALGKFLERYLEQHPSRITVFVHSPEKGFLRQSSCPGTGLDALAVDGPFVANPELLKKSLFARITTPDAAPQVVGPILSIARNQVLALDEFLALLHSDELQNWVRSIRFRWRTLSRVRGILSELAEVQVGKENVTTAVVNGIPLSKVLLAWKRLADASGGQPQTPERRGASLDQLPDGRCRHTQVLQPSKKCRMVGRYLLDKGLTEGNVLEGLRASELFHEARVGSAERLIAWFVFFHAMAEPSSRLPFLNYDLGKSESRLRVASTPAPVPVLSGSLSAEVLGDSTGTDDPDSSDCLGPHCYSV